MNIQYLKINAFVFSESSPLKLHPHICKLGAQNDQPLNWLLAMRPLVLISFTV